MSKPRPEPAGFELQISHAEESFAWTTKKVNDLIVAIEDGHKPKVSPFHDGNPNLRKGNIVFEYTPEELREIKRCATDIVYFANKYCTVMTDDGLQTITLRGYQENMLRQFHNERFNVCLASRQIGKCSFFNTNIIINNSGLQKHSTIGSLYYDTLAKIRKLTPLERLKKFLWSLYTKLDQLDRKQELSLIDRIKN